jgi:uncharacterized protein YndB with AHSA1/START domain
MTRPTESLAHIVDPQAVRLERMLDTPIDTAWTWLVDPEKRGRWFMGGPIDPRPGGTMTLKIDHDSLSPEPGTAPDWYAEFAGKHFDHQILAIDPPNLLRFTWGDGSEVSWILEPVGDRTRFIILHEKLADRKAMGDVSGGWHSHSGVLVEVAAGRTPPNFWTLHEGVGEFYAEQMGEEKP